MVSATSLRYSTSSNNFMYSSVWFVSECPIQNFTNDSGTRDLLRCVARNLRNEWKPALGTESDSNTGWRLRRKTFDCASGRPFALRNTKPSLRSPISSFSIVTRAGYRSTSRTALAVLGFCVEPSQADCLICSVRKSFEMCATSSPRASPILNPEPTSNA
jgi:hypothetical protein